MKKSTKNLLAGIGIAAVVGAAAVAVSRCAAKYLSDTSPDRDGSKRMRRLKKSTTDTQQDYETAATQDQDQCE